VLGVITNFFDTLGVGSFAPTMAWLKFRRLVPDRLIPRTMLAGHTLPAVVQAIIFLVLLGVLVDPVLLIGCVLATLAGGLLGVSVVIRTKVWVVQLVVGLALILAACMYALTNLHLMPGGGTATSLPLTLMLIAIAANFVFGLLLNFGIGNYAPDVDHAQLDGHGPATVLPDHGCGCRADGIRREHALYRDRRNRSTDCDRNSSGWGSRHARRRIHREEHVAGDVALARGRRRAVRRGRDAEGGRDWSKGQYTSPGAAIRSANRRGGRHGNQRPSRPQVLRNPPFHAIDLLRSGAVGAEH
jgi:hypothetical protein